MAVKKKEVYKQGYKGKLKKGQLIEVMGKRRKIEGQHTMGGTSWYKTKGNRGAVISTQCYSYDKAHGLVK